MRMNAEQMTPLAPMAPVRHLSGRATISNARGKLCEFALDGWMILAPDFSPSPLLSDPICCISNNGLKFDEVGPEGERNAIQNAHACIVDSIAHVGGVWRRVAELNKLLGAEGLSTDITLWRLQFLLRLGCPPRHFTNHQE